MRTAAVLLVLTSAALAQSPTKYNWSNFYAAQSRYRNQGSEALAREQARSKDSLCAQGEAGGNASIGACLTKEIKITDEDYLEYVRSIGALLRLVPPAVPAAVSRSKLPLDSAEAEWQTYREQACTSVATQWGGGDQTQVAYPDCILKVTWNHMNELANLYSDLWH